MSGSKSPSQTKEYTQVETAPCLNNEASRHIVDILEKHETLLWDLHKRLSTSGQPEISQQLVLLEVIKSELASASTPAQFVWNAILQTVGVAIGILFGVFSIFGWHGQAIANNQGLHANQIALMTLCMTSNSSEIVGPCEEILKKSSVSMAHLVAFNFQQPSLTNGTTWPWPTPYDWYLRDPTGAITMVVIPVFCGMVGIYATRKIHQERFRSVYSK